MLVAALILPVALCLPFVAYGLSILLSHIFGVPVGGYFCWGLAAAVVMLSIYIEHRLKVYEFQNRSSGGVVGFKKYGDAVLHHRLKGWSRTGTGLVAIVIAFLGAVDVVSDHSLRQRSVDATFARLIRPSSTADESQEGAKKPRDKLKPKGELADK